MSDLSPELQELVFAGKNASRPTSADFTRVQDALLARLGTTTHVGTGVVQKNTSLSASRLLTSKVITITVVGVALVLSGAAYFIAQSSTAQVVSKPPIEVVAATTLLKASKISPIATIGAAVAPTPSAELSPPVTTANNAIVVPRTHASNRPSDSLSEEASILSRAEAELHRGRAEYALRLLNEHERKYPKGILAEERTAAKIQALCSLGRNIEANSQLARLKPGSLHGARTQQACSSNPAPAGNSSSTQRTNPPKTGSFTNSP
jgi:hypothetical protein